MPLRWGRWGGADDEKRVLELKKTEKPEGRSLPAFGAANGYAGDNSSLQGMDDPELGQWRGGAGGGIRRGVRSSVERREFAQSGRERSGREERASTHKGFRPTSCHTVAFTSFATPAPESATNRGHPQGDGNAEGQARCRTATLDNRRRGGRRNQYCANGCKNLRQVRAVSAAIAVSLLR